MACWLALANMVAAADVAPGDAQPYCGSRCLYVALKLLERPIESLEEVEEYLGEPPGTGYSMEQLAEGAEHFGAHWLGVETTFDRLRRRRGRFACIAHVDDRHFVLFHELDDSGMVHVLDPPRSYKVAEPVLGLRWKGKALLIGNEPLLAEEDLPSENSALIWILLGSVAAGALCLAAWKITRGGP